VPFVCPINRAVASMSNATLNITVCGLLELNDYSSVECDYIVSILDPDTPEPEALSTFGPHSRCTLRFHDAVSEQGSLILPESHHIRQLLTFGSPIKPQHHVLVHCFAGLCRSTAAALLLLAQSDRASAPQTAVRRLLEIAPHAWPNARMLQLGDEILGYDGSLVEAMQPHYQFMREQHPLYRGLVTKPAKPEG
jgi:predicted protein tyrosine phosphatase